MSQGDAHYQSCQNYPGEGSDDYLPEDFFGGTNNFTLICLQKRTMLSEKYPQMPQGLALMWMTMT